MAMLHTPSRHSALREYPAHGLPFGRGTVLLETGRSGSSSQLQSADETHATGSTHSGVQVPATQVHAPPISTFGGPAPSAHDPVAGTKTQARALVQPVFFAPVDATFRRSAHVPSTQAHVPGRGPLSSHAAGTGAPTTHAVGMHGSSNRQSASFPHGPGLGGVGVDGVEGTTDEVVTGSGVIVRVSLGRLHANATKERPRSGRTLRAYASRVGHRKLRSMRPPIPRPPRQPGPTARTILFGFTRRERQAITAWAILGAFGLVTLIGGIVATVSSREWPWLVPYLALASPLLFVPLWGARKLRKLRRNRLHAYVHGEPLRARIVMRSVDPPAVWWDFHVGGTRYEGMLAVHHAGQLPCNDDDAHVWILHDPKRPRRNTLWLA